jgi:hypothetical protein
MEFMEFLKTVLDVFTDEQQLDVSVAARAPRGMAAAAVACANLAE